MEATSPSYLLTRLVYVPQSPSTYLKIRPRPHHFTHVSYSPTTTPSRPLDHFSTPTSHSPSVYYNNPSVGGYQPAGSASDPSPSSPFYLALRLINASVLGTRNQDVSPPHQLIELPALPDAAA